MKRGWSKKEKILYGALALYVLFYLLFYPNYYLVNDEHHYIRGAYLLSEGKFWVDDPLAGYHFVSDGEHYFPRYSPGMYFLLVPFIVFGLKWVFLSGLLLHIIGFLVFIKILKLLKIDTIAALLYLVYPPFVYYSATAFADYPLTVFILLGWYFYLKKKPVHHVLSGVCFGFSFLLKPNALIFFAIFYLFALMKDRKKFFLMFAGAVPLGLLHMGYNWVVHGGATTIGHAFFDQGYGQGSNPFLTQNILPQFIMNLFNQIVLLLILYPFMAAVLFTTKIKEVRYTAWLSLIFFSMIVYTTLVAKLEWFIVVQYRYMLPLLVFFIPEYYVLLTRILRKVFSPKLAKIAFSLLVIGFFVMSIMLLALIQSASARNLDIVQDITTKTGKDTLILGSGLGEMMNEFYGRDYITVRGENEAASYEGYQFTDDELQEIFNKETIILISEKEEDYPIMFEKKYRSRLLGDFFRSFDMKWYVIKNATTELPETFPGYVK